MAMSVKCLSNLRQCGQARSLYAQNNHNYVIPVRAGGSPPSATEPGTDTTQAVPYELNGFTYGASSNDATHNTSAAWWMSFLATYISDDTKGGHGDTGPDGIQLRQKAVFYCPAWDGPDWPEVTGYSMNYMVSLSSTHPALGVAASSPTIPQSEWLNIQLVSPASGGGTVAGSGDVVQAQPDYDVCTALLSGGHNRVGIGMLGLAQPIDGLDRLHAQATAAKSDPGCGQWTNVRWRS